MTFQDWLKKRGACEEAQFWAKGKSFEQVYATCDRGDWLCWLFFRTNRDDLQVLTLVKGLQVNQVRHLMKHESSIAAVDAAIAFGRGQITAQQLNAAAAAAAAAYADAADNAAYDAADAVATAAGAAARAASFARSADIFRENIPLEMINRPWDEQAE